MKILTCLIVISFLTNITCSRATIYDGDDFEEKKPLVTNVLQETKVTNSNSVPCSQRKETPKLNDLVNKSSNLNHLNMGI